MPKLKLRSMVVAPPGYNLISVDLSQAESWIVAYLADDPNMKHSLNFSDIHSDTAKVLFPTETQLVTSWKLEPFIGMRYTSKRVNHGSGYGMGPERQTEVINKDSSEPPYITVTIKQVRTYQEKWHGHYRNVKGVYWFETQEQLQRNRTLVTPYGRVRRFYGAWGNELFKSAYAHIPQSTVADHFNGAVQRELGIKGGLREVHARIIKPSRGEIRITNQSHDSLLVEAPTAIAKDVGLEIESILRRPLVVRGEEFTIPTDLEIGEDWGNLEKVKKAA